MIFQVVIKLTGLMTRTDRNAHPKHVLIKRNPYLDPITDPDPDLTPHISPVAGASSAYVAHPEVHSSVKVYGLFTVDDP